MLNALYTGCINMKAVRRITMKGNTIIPNTTSNCVKYAISSH